MLLKVRQSGKLSVNTYSASLLLADNFLFRSVVSFIVTYEGSLMPQTKDPCQKAACAIQKCLQLNNYMENRCEQEIQAMRDCCSKLATRQSICCSGFQDQQVTKGSSSIDGTRTANINS
ncbi:cx9C motif-containing protein 4 [Leptodactylus fuscus]|uniref:cx9C motif-containing protein 4 n=1 Tax=Leptodactylus fuscus TaxID=238119 RepID=UPI003F4F3EF2